MMESQQEETFSFRVLGKKKGPHKRAFSNKDDFTRKNNKSARSRVCVCARVDIERRE